MCSGWLRSTVRSGPSRKATTSPYSCLRRHTKPSRSREKASRWAPGKRARGPGRDGVETITSPSVSVLHLVRVWRHHDVGGTRSTPSRVQASQPLLWHYWMPLQSIEAPTENVYRECSDPAVAWRWRAPHCCALSL